MYVPASPRRTRRRTSARSAAESNCGALVAIVAVVSASARAIAPVATEILGTCRGAAEGVGIATSPSAGECIATAAVAHDASATHKMTARFMGGEGHPSPALLPGVEKGRDEGEEALRCFPERHMPRGGNYDLTSIH